MVDRKYDTERMLEYAKKAAPFGHIPRYVPEGSGRLPEEAPKAKTIPSFSKGGGVKNYCKGGKVISARKF